MLKTSRRFKLDPALNPNLKPAFSLNFQEWLSFVFLTSTDTGAGTGAGTGGGADAGAGTTECVNLDKTTRAHVHKLDKVKSKQSTHIKCGNAKSGHHRKKPTVIKICGKK